MCQQALQGSRLAHVDDDDQIAVEKAMSRAELVEKLGLVVSSRSPFLYVAFVVVS